VFAYVILTGDRGFESISLHRRVRCEPDFLDQGCARAPATVSGIWLAEYLHEMTVFPKGKHDDQVDSTAQFLDWFKRPFPGQGFFENMRRLRSVSARSLGCFDLRAGPPFMKEISKRR
jgi:hypothetical protein